MRSTPSVNTTLSSSRLQDLSALTCALYSEILNWLQDHRHASAVVSAMLVHASAVVPMVRNSVSCHSGRQDVFCPHQQKRKGRRGSLMRVDFTIRHDDRGIADTSSRSTRS